MKKWLLITGAALILVIITFYYVVSKGEFVIWGTSHLYTDAPIVEEMRPFYIGYDLKWEGMGDPTLTNVTLIKNDGMEVSQNDAQISVTPMIDVQRVTGVIDEETVIEEGYIDAFVPIENYKVTDTFMLIFRVELLDANYENNITHLNIEHKNFGIRQQQLLDFEGFFKDAE